MLEAGVVENIEENAVTKKICRPYIEQEFREELLSNGSESTFGFTMLSYEFCQ